MNTAAADILRQYRDLLYWKFTSRGNTPPPVHKQRLVKSYARRYGLGILVETGTFNGDMLAACRKGFDRLYSIELDRQLYLRARERFADCRKITLIPGDSAVVLPIVLKAVDGPALFWLDAHAMQGLWDERRPITPIIEELNLLLESEIKKYVILIDDARLFRDGTGYPSLAEVEALVQNYHPGWVFECKDDVVRIHAESNR